MARGDKLREKAKENQKAPTGGKAGMTLQNSDKPIDTRTGGRCPGDGLPFRTAPPGAARPGTGDTTPRPAAWPPSPGAPGPAFHGRAQGRPHPATLPRPHSTSPTAWPAPRPAPGHTSTATHSPAPGTPHTRPRPALVPDAAMRATGWGTKGAWPAPDGHGGGPCCTPENGHGRAYTAPGAHTRGYAVCLGFWCS